MVWRDRHGYERPKLRGMSNWHLVRMIKRTREVADARATRLADFLEVTGKPRDRHRVFRRDGRVAYAMFHSAHRRLMVLWAERQRRIYLGSYWPFQEEWNL